MVPTLTILGRFSEAARGAVIPWLETTLVTVAIMAVPGAEVTCIDGASESGAKSSRLEK